MNQKSKKNRSRSLYLAALGAITAPLCISSLNANATTSVPTYLTQEATSINVTVTDRVTFNVLTDSNTATVSSITVANNLTSVPVVVSNIQATAQTGYNLEAYSTDFSTYDTGSNHFGIAYTRANESDEDISGTGYATDEEIAAEGNHVFTFAGKSSAYSTAVAAASNTQIANIILTLGMKPVAQTALTIQDLTYMQDFKDLTAEDKADVLASMTEETIYSLTDNRDNKSYNVFKLADGNIWMAENLDLGRTTLTTDLTSANTNLSSTVTAATFNSWKKTTSSETKDAGEFVPITTSNAYDHLDTDSVSGVPYGTLYNFYAASAGTISGYDNNNDAQHDICPSGWKLSSASMTEEGEFYELSSSYYDNELGGSLVPLPMLSRAGRMGNDMFYQQGESGIFWSASRRDYDGMRTATVYYFEGYPPVLSVGGNASRKMGFSVRCVVQ